MHRYYYNSCSLYHSMISCSCVLVLGLLLECKVPLLCVANQFPVFFRNTIAVYCAVSCSSHTPSQIACLMMP